jgi:hypothetical protein
MRKFALVSVWDTETKSGIFKVNMIFKVLSFIKKINNPMCTARQIQEITTKGLFLIVLMFGLTGFTSSSAQTNLYSRQSANYNALLTWYTNAGRTTPFIGTPGAGHILNIGQGHTITIQAGQTPTFAGIVIHDAGASGNFIIGNTTDASNASVTVTGDITINNAGLLQLGGTGNSTNTLNASGDIIINGSGTLRTGPTAASAGATNNLNIVGNIDNDNVFNTNFSADASTVTFTAGAARTLNGTGTYTFRNVTMNTGGTNVAIERSIVINGILNFASNGLLVVDANSNITLAAAGTVTGFTNARYIQLDGGTGANSNFINTTNGAASWQITYPIGTSSGGYSPIVLPTVATNPTAGSTISVKAIYNNSIQGQLRRTFRIVVAGNTGGTTFTGPQFNYNTTADLSGGDALSNYNTIWHLNAGTGSWTTVAGANAGAGMFSVTAPSHNLNTGTYYYTIGSSTAYPNTWYTYQSGVWSDWRNWTLDPSGTTLVNGLNLPPQPGDEIVILSGITITNDVAGQVTSSTTINSVATLDMMATTGNTLGTVAGTGRLRINGSSLPTGTYASFVSTTGGTIEYYDAGATVTVASTQTTTYNNLIFSNSSTTTNATFITTSNLIINGSLDILQTGAGRTVTWQINDATAANRTMTIAGDLTVSAGGRIRVGTGNEGTAATPQHSLTLSGNLNNNGSVKFYDDADTEYSQTNYNNGAVYNNPLQGNAVNVTFNGATNKIVTCNGETDFYRFILNKGTGQQALLSLTSSAATNMRLFGPANLSGLTPGSSNNALSIQNGTLELKGTLTIPILCTNGTGAAGSDYTIIPSSGGLWINSPNVNVTITNNSATNDDQRLLVNGLLRISNGTLTSGYGRGLGSGTGGTLLVEGGVVSTWQYRPLLGSTNVSYIQTGGTVNVGTTGYNGTAVTSGIVDFATETYARFSIPAETSTFQMSNGTLNIGSPSNNSTLAGADGIDIQSGEGNFTVTGGTINVYVPTSGVNFGINSSASFYDLNVYDEGSTLTTTLLQPLTVLRHFKIRTNNNPVFDCNNQNLTVGGDIEIQANTTLTPGTNTITLNGAAAQTWTNNGTISGLTNVVVKKSAGVVTLSGPGTTNFPSITGGTVGLTLTSGTFNDGGQTITVTGALNNSATHASTGTGSIVFSRTGNVTTTIGGADGFFGNLTLTTNGNLTASTAGNQTVNGNLQLNGTTTSILNIGSYNLTVLGTITTTHAGGLDDSHRIQTAGFRNDGGLTRRIPAGIATDVLYPFGTAGVSAYSPATIAIASTSGGTVTIRPVTGAHPNANPVGQSVQYFWRITNTAFTGVSAVTHKLYNYGSATLLAGTTGSYKPLRYNPTNFTWTIGTTYNAGGLTIIPNFTFGFNIDGEYSAGNLTAGAVTVFYSRQTGDWNLRSTWSNTPCTGPGACGPQVGVGVFPSANSPVVIGNADNPHTVTIDANSRTCGSLFIAPTSTLDCGVRTGLNFGVNTSGTGTLRIGSANFPGGDFINFVGPAGGTVEWYGAFTIPSTVATYYNLIANATGIMTMPASNLTIYNNFTKIGASTLQTTTTGVRTITVGGDLSFNTGLFNFQGTTATHFNVTGTTTVNSLVTVAIVGIGNVQHSLTTSGSIVNNGTLTLRNAPHAVDLIFTGAANRSFTGTNPAASTGLANLTLNKGTDQTSVLTFNVMGTVGAPSTGWLTLINGTIDFANSGTFGLSTSTTTAYTIPSTTKLKVSSGTVNIIANVDDDDADLLLAGTLEVAGGAVNVNADANLRDRNNDIQYASAGSPTIIVSGGSLYVNGGIRRPTTTLSGALVYNQSAGVVTIGGRNCDANNTRGVFEIEGNAGSSFTMSGGELNVRRSSGGAQFADLYINALSSSVSATSLIQIGMPTNTAVTSPLSINVVPAIGSFSTLGTTTAQVVDMRSSELTTLGTLIVGANSTLETNALNVNIGGDLSISGTYNGTISGGNTTTFNGSGAQAGALTAGSSFQNITINKPAGVATLSGTTTINNLSILNGDLSVTNTLNINGDIINNSTQTGAGIININGLVGTTAHSITSAGGSFTNLTLGGTSTTKRVTVTGDLTINGNLNFSTGGTSRYLFIQSNKLTLGQSATISNSGANRFIRTNGVSSDLGVMKNWVAGAAASFTYPVGTRTNYTPASFTLTVSAPGSLTVAPVDDQHPTANAVGQQILNYYWVVTRGTGLAYAATGSHSYQFPTGFIGGTGGTLIAAHLDALKLVGWTPSPGNGGGFTTAAPNTIMTFTNLLNTNLPGPGIIPADAQVEFHYTAGTSLTLPNPVTPVYSRIENASTVGNLAVGGDWTLASNWTTSPTGIGGTIQSVMPIGRPIVIVTGSRINMNSSGLRAFATQINGLMVIPNTTSGHNLGSMSGTGTLRTSNSTLPAGTYTNFVSAAGGTIEYVAPMNMNNLRNTYNNLSVSGTGTLNTAIAIALNGNLTIASGTTLNNSSANQNISISGNWINNGTFIQGTGTVLFTGTSATQNISGTNAFVNVTMTKSSNNVTLNGATTINGLLTLTSGNIITSSTFPLILGASSTYSGGNSTSFVHGPARSTIGAGATLAFPVGSMLNNQFRPASIFNTSGSDTWTIEYFGKSPSVDGFSHGAHNTPDLGKVSMFEYWNITRVGATSASVTLSYNTGSYIPPDIGNVANLRVAHWDSGNNRWDLPSGGGTPSQSGTNITGTVTVTNVTSFSPFTLGSLDLDSPLPVSWLSFTANRIDPNVVLEWKTAQERSNDHFDIERSVDGKTFNKVGSRIGAGNSNEILKYQFIDSEVSAHEAYYYRIKQVDTDGKADYSKIVMVTGSGVAKQRWIAMPNPVNDQSTFHIDLVDYSVEPDHAVKIQIVSSNGSLVYEGAGSLSDLNPALQNKLQDLGVGIYLIQISDDAAREHFRIVRY